MGKYNPVWNSHHVFQVITRSGLLYKGTITWAAQTLCLFPLCHSNRVEHDYHADKERKEIFTWSTPHVDGVSTFYPDLSLFSFVVMSSSGSIASWLYALFFLLLYFDKHHLIPDTQYIMGLDYKLLKIPVAYIKQWHWLHARYNDKVPKQWHALYCSSMNLMMS